MNQLQAAAIVNRIRQLRRQFAGERGKSRFAHSLGLSASTYSYYEQDRVPPVDVLLKIAELTDSDIHWLLTGNEKNSEQTTTKKDGLTAEIGHLIKNHPDIAKAVAAFVKLLCDEHGLSRQKASQVTSEHKKLIPILGRTAAGIIYLWNDENLDQLTQGEEITELSALIKSHLSRDVLRSTDNGGAVATVGSRVLKGAEKVSASLVQVTGDIKGASQVVEFLDCEEISDKFTDCFALRIDGDSMAPMILDGDVVVLSPSVKAEQGDCAVIKIKNQIGVTCKLIRYDEDNAHIIPVNGKFGTKIIPKNDIAWALGVLCRLRI